MDLNKILKHKHFHWGGPVVAGGLTWILSGMLLLGAVVAGVFFAYNTYNKNNSKHTKRHNTSKRHKAKRRKR